MLPDLHSAETARCLVALAWDLRETLPRAPKLTEHPAEPIHSYQVRDRLEDCGLHGSWEAFAALFGINPTCVGARPKAHARFYMSAPGLLAADFARLLAQLSSWGLPVDPAPWIDALRPALLKRRTITHSELRVLWFYREHRGMKERLKISAWPENVPSSFVTANGRRISDDYGWARASPAPRRRTEQPMHAAASVASSIRA